MGCWNHTCAVTNLPILYEEEVEVILLRSNSMTASDRSFCYPNTSWTPMSLTFSGTYNDYGSVENCHGAAFDIIIDAIRENLHEMEETDTEDHGHTRAVTKEDFDVVQMFDIEHDGLLYIKNPLKCFLDAPKTCRVKHIVIRKDVYDGIVTKTKYGRWWNSKTDITLDRLDTDVFTKDLDEFHTMSLEDDDSIIAKSIARYQGFSESATADLIKFQDRGVYGMDRPINPMDILVDLREQKSDLYEGVLENTTRFAFFDIFMNNARKTYTVPSGMGSQDDTTKSQELCARLTLSSAKAQRKWQKERYEE